MLFVYLAKSFVEPFQNFIICVSKVHGVVGVCCHTLETKQQGGTQGHYIGVTIPEINHVYLFSLGFADLVLFVFNSSYKFFYSAVVKVDICQGGEKAVYYKFVGDFAVLIFFF